MIHVTESHTLPTDQLFNLEFQFKSVFNVKFQPKFGIQLGIEIQMGIDLGECSAHLVLLMQENNTHIHDDIHNFQQKGKHCKYIGSLIYRKADFFRGVWKRRKNSTFANILTSPVAAVLTSRTLASFEVYPLTAILLPVWAA